MVEAHSTRDNCIEQGSVLYCRGIRVSDSLCRPLMFALVLAECTSKGWIKSAEMRGLHMAYCLRFRDIVRKKKKIPLPPPRHFQLERIRR
jgi:hypothetical protein